MNLNVYSAVCLFSVLCVFRSEALAFHVTEAHYSLICWMYLSVSEESELESWDGCDATDYFCFPPCPSYNSFTSIDVGYFCQLQLKISDSSASGFLFLWHSCHHRPSGHVWEDDEKSTWRTTVKETCEQRFTRYWRLISKVPDFRKCLLLFYKKKKDKPNMLITEHCTITAWLPTQREH